MAANGRAFLAALELGYKGQPLYGASGMRYADLDAVEELELWHQVWDDTVLETLDYVAATEAADKAIHFRTPSRAIDHQARAALALAKPGSVIDYNPGGVFARVMMADYQRKYQGATKMVNGRDWMYVNNEWISLPTRGQLNP